ncbi:hypothetical protein QBC32DRAFT_314292 [Pseudoneurospora amorphoporcata]|uniref:Uncharacterized protein n=1 Tax=Pseudoneurospora amorphoporcata TaxID=241081 RepID=A0AAN6SFU1_9PEZI|nr:hypothetical protein QBC32DRAFT_314292 [Pseudoneurospora amorphoporcata]
MSNLEDEEAPDNKSVEDENVEFKKKITLLENTIANAGLRKSTSVEDESKFLRYENVALREKRAREENANLGAANSRPNHRNPHNDRSPSLDRQRSRSPTSSNSCSNCSKLLSELNEVKNELDNTKDSLLAVKAQAKELGTEKKKVTIETTPKDTDRYDRLTEATDNDSDREGTSTSNLTTTSTGRLSAKEKDPPYFHNEQNKDTISFNVWYRRIQNKLKLNANYFFNDEAKKMYIENRTTEKAARDLEPYLGNGPHCIKTSQQLLDYLKNEYHDHNRKEKAILEFNELVFKMNQDF